MHQNDPILRSFFSISRDVNKVWRLHMNNFEWSEMQFQCNCRLPPKTCMHRIQCVLCSHCPYIAIGCSASTWGGLRTFWSLRLFQLLCWKLTKPHLIECKACNSWRVCAIVHFCGVKDKWIAASGVEQPMQSLFCGAPQPHHNYTITTTTTTTQPDFALPSLLLHPSTIIVHTKWS